MATYFVARWHHSNNNDPVRIYEELSEDRLELRKVEEFPDGRLVRSDRVAPELDTSLSWVPVPPEKAIAAQSDFTIEPLTADGFDAVWRRAVDAG